MIAEADQDLEQRVVPFVAGYGPQQLLSTTPRGGSCDHNLPSQPGVLVGRETELETIHEHVRRDDVRLLTLTGCTGVGKSRLAIEAARRAAYAFPDGVRFIDLTGIEEISGFLPVIAHALDLPRPHGCSLPESLEEYCRHRTMLLVLDGCERLLPAYADLARLIAACAHLTLFVTSLEPLHLRWEHVMPVPPLPLPAVEDSVPLDELAAVPSVSLFIHRAQAMRLDFRLTEENACDIAELCVRLEGHPLAIELAAAQTNLLPPSAILHRLDGRFELLQGRTRDIPTRHRSLRQSMAWRFQLLDPHEQALIRRLSVFIDGFCIEVVSAVVPPAEQKIDVLSELSMLVDKSLILAAVTDDGEPRFFMTDALCGYGREQLSHSGEEDEVRERHAAFYLALAERGALEIHGPDGGTWLSRLDREAGNLRAALSWARGEAAGDTELLLVAALAAYWWSRGQLREGILHLDGALLRHPRGDQRLRLRALSGLANLLRWSGDYQRVKQVHEEVVDLARELDDSALIARSRMNLAATLVAEGRYPEARAMLDEVLDSWERGENSWGVAQTVLYQASADLAEGRYVDGEAHAAESLSIFQSLEDGRGKGAALVVLARAAALQTHVPRAVRLLMQALHVACEVNDCRFPGMIAEEVAHVAASKAEPLGVAQLVGATDALREGSGFTHSAFEESRYQEVLSRLRSQLGDAALLSARQEGRRIPLEQLSDRAMAVLDDLDTRPDMQRETRRTTSHDPLSKREHDVLELVAQGLSNKEIAKTLFISENTAKFHVSSLLNKLGADTRAQIVAQAAHRNLLRTESRTARCV